MRVRIGVAMMMAAAYAAMATTANADLIGYWNFDEAAGVTCADSSGSGNTGTAHDTSVATGVSGNARAFNSSSDYVSLANGLFGNLGSGQFTVSAWVQESNARSGDAWLRILSVVPGDSWRPYFDIGVDRRVNFDRIWAGIRDANGTQDLAYGKDDGNGTALGWAGDGKWHHMVYGRDAGNVYLYLDNALKVSETSAGLTPNLTGLTAMIGNTPNGASNGWDGSIDEVQVYNTWIGASGVAYLNANPGQAVPEPGTVTLLAAGLLSLLAYAWRKRK